MESTRVKVGLVEIGESFGGEYYLPYSLGILQAYSQKYLSNRDAYEFGHIIYKHGEIERDVEYLSTMDVVFYSAYLWNFKISLEMARRLKEKNDVVNVFGGPQVPEMFEKMKRFLQRYPFIDAACCAEGELPFLKILENHATRNWNNVPSLAYRAEGGAIAFNRAKGTIADIDQIPSPYLEGVFDDLIRLHPSERWLGRLETNRGCPFTCAFCYWGKKAERRVRPFEMERVFGEIDWFSRHRVEFVFCCDANFGILKRDMEIARKVAENKRTFGFPKAFSVQNTKNSKETIVELQKILNDAGLQKGVNLALQSTNAKTLRYIERSNIDNRTYSELQKTFTTNGIPTFTDLIIGLPGETYETFTEGVSEIIAKGQHNRIQFIDLTILENTSMAGSEYQQEHGLSIVEAKFLSHHSSLNGGNGVGETQFLVVGTKSMPTTEWIRTRVFAWMTSLLHFDKLLQIPFVILHETCGLSYRDLIEAFVATEGQENILTETVSAFQGKAFEMLKGDSAYWPSKEWLNIMWYPDELAFIRLNAEAKIGQFYDEAERRLVALAAGKVPTEVVSQSVNLNKTLLKQPFITEDKALDCDYNLWDVYNGALRGDHRAMTKGSFSYVIDRTSHHWDNWEDWCREVVWYGNKKGDYVYSVRTIEGQGRNAQ
jgi:radical SAM superfamily enzyme YgiQ (UPF0313 family)